MHSAHMNLKSIRETRGYADQTALAEALGLDQSTVHRMEAGAPNVSFRNFLRAADLLEVSLAEIFSDDRTPAETVLVRHWRSLPKAQQDQWAEHLRLAAGQPQQAGAESPETDPKKGTTKD